MFPIHLFIKVLKLVLVICTNTGNVKQFPLCFVATWLLAFFCIFLLFSLHVCVYTTFPQLFIFAFVPPSSPKALQSLETPFPLRVSTHWQFYFLLVFLWFDVDLYNTTILRVWKKKCRLAKVSALQIYRAKFSLRIFFPDQYPVIFICSDPFKLSYFQGLLLHFWNRYCQNGTIASFKKNIQLHEYHQLQIQRTGK